MREIQLGGKQLVFLFMASVVLAVAIFLLGISVGRGVHTADGSTSATEVAVNGETSATPLPEMPATVTTPADSLYHGRLEGETPPAVSAQDPATPAAAAPKVADEAPPVAEDAAPAAKTAEPPQQKPAAKTTAEPPKAAAPAPAPAATGTWFVQVDSFRSRENADRQAARLKAKNYAAAVSTSAGLFRVRVGPFAQRADAERVRQRLQREEGLKPSIQR